MAKKSITFKILALLVVLSFLLTGCQNRTDYDVIFKKDMLIDLNSNMSPLTLIDTINNHKITQDDIKNDKIVYRNFVIQCDRIDTFNQGIFEVVYKTNNIDNKEIRKKVSIKDVSPPVISLKQKEISCYTDKIKTINYYDYFDVKDNSGNNYLTTVIDDYEVKNKKGIYKVFISVTDQSQNIAQETLIVNVKEKPQTKQNISSNENIDNNKKIDKNKNSNRKNNQTQTKTKKKHISNFSQYNKYFSGKSINSYNKACQYASKILNQNKANGYSVVPDGKGYQVEFN